MHVAGADEAMNMLLKLLQAPSTGPDALHNLLEALLAAPRAMVVHEFHRIVEAIEGCGVPIQSLTSSGKLKRQRVAALAEASHAHALAADTGLLEVLSNLPYFSTSAALENVPLFLVLHNAFSGPGVLVDAFHANQEWIHLPCASLSCGTHSRSRQDLQTAH